MFQLIFGEKILWTFKSGLEEVQLWARDEHIIDRMITTLFRDHMPHPVLHPVAAALAGRRWVRRCRFRLTRIAAVAAGAAAALAATACLPLGALV